MCTCFDTHPGSTGVISIEMKLGQLILNIVLSISSNYTAHFAGHHNTFDKSRMLTRQRAGVRLNKKDSLTRYGNSHVKDKTS